MEPPEIVNFVRNFATMVRVKGPDPKGLKMTKSAFHHHHSGITTLSASGFLLPDNLIKACGLDTGKNSSSLIPRSAVVVTVASVVEPFLARGMESDVQGIPELIPYAQIHVMAERKGRSSSSVKMHEGEPQWFDAQILSLVDVPASSLAIKSLIGASSSPSSEPNWDIGWSLASVNEFKNPLHQGRNSFTESNRHWSKRELKDPSIIGEATTRIVVLQVSELCTEDLPEIMISPSCNRGNFLLAVGSPFGILSPVHFFNSVSAGSVTNCYPPTASDRSLLMADIHCLPGMEGAPVFCGLSKVIGLLTRPLRHIGGAQVQLVIPWEAMASACKESSEMMPLNMQNNAKSPLVNLLNTDALVSHSFKSNTIARSIHRLPTTYHLSSRFEENLLAPVCLVSLNDGVWASGVVLNNQGLILTNAHLLEPWRYRGTTINNDGGRTSPRKRFASNDNSTLVRSNRVGKDTQTVMLDATSLDHMKQHEYRPTYRSQQQVSVRLDNLDASVWCDAKVVYISKGPLDVSLLQLQSVPVQLCPVSMDTTCPAPGSKAYVVGHGLFGPSCGLHPSISGGVVAKVVKTRDNFPAMIETTAAVHPGGSGGAVLNSAGHMIGLVTSNAKHGGRTIIPHLNFSIPCAALEPIFKFAKDMENTSVLDELDKPIKELSSVWAMTPPLPPNPDVPPSVPIIGDRNILTEGHRTEPQKGSRFAKFMAERQEELFRKGSTEMTTARKSLPRDIVPSKL